jgi:hypothetical protein
MFYINTIAMHGYMTSCIYKHKCAWMDATMHAGRNYIVVRGTNAP